MRLSRLSVVAVLSAATLVTAAASPSPSPSARARTAEVRRIRTHFDSVLTELSARDLSALTGAQRTRRANVVQTLGAYRDAGVFPHNYDFPGRAVPYFVDRETGTLCAVANLLASTGRRDIVDRVARANNNVWVAELASDSAFVDWLDANGLTLAEAARIQVPYVQPVSKAEEVRNATFVVAAPLALGGAAVTSIWNAVGNADGHSRVVTTLGLATGVTAVAAGMLVMTKSDLPRGAWQAGAVSALMGGFSVALSERAMHRHSQIVAAQRDAEQKRSVAQATISPIVTTGRAGVAISLSY